MKLTEQDADLFFDLTRALQFYVNHQLNIIPNTHSIEQYADYSLEEKYPVREAVYDNPDLIQAFVNANPNQLSQEHLALVKEWQHFVRGKFYIERYLKKYAIFISDDDKIYGVYALHDSFDKICPKAYLPRYVHTVLLPFKGKIIYDGLLQHYNVFFGGGTKARLKESYLTAKQNNKIIETLGTAQIDQAESNKPTTPATNLQPHIEELLKLAKKLKANADHPAINRLIFNLVKASLELADAAITTPDDINVLYKRLNKVRNNYNQVNSTLNRMER